MLGSYILIMNYLTKDMKELYSENCKSLIKAIDDTNKWEDILCSMIGRIKIVLMSIPKAVHRFSAIPIKMPVALFIV